MSAYELNQQYWEEAKTAYGYHAQQTRTPPDPGTRPEHMGNRRFGDILRVPVAEGTVNWGFHTAAARDLFIQDFGGEVLL